MTRPLRICLITTFYPPHAFGGDGTAVQALARALARRGHAVTVICDEDAYRTLHGGHVEPASDGGDGITVHRLRSHVGALSVLLTQQAGRPVVHGKAIRRLVADGDFDVVHFHNVSLVGGPGVLDVPAPLRLYTAHEHWLVCATHVLWRYGREACPERDCLRCVLLQHRPPQLWRYNGYLEEQLRHVHAFVATSEFSRRKHRELGFPYEMNVIPGFLPDCAPPAEQPARQPYFLYVGRLQRSKGLDDVLPLFRGAIEAELYVAGEGPHRRELERLAGGSRRIHFVGWQSGEELSKLYRGATAVLVPSIGAETFGLVAIEAFSHGVPVLARNTGPLPELVKESGAGQIFSTPADLLRAMRRLMLEPQRRAAMSQLAWRSFSTRYAESAVMPRYFDLLERTARSRGSAGVVDALQVRPVA